MNDINIASYADGNILYLVADNVADLTPSLEQASYTLFKWFNPLSAKSIKWSNTLKQIVGKLPTTCLSVFDHFSGLALKGLKTTF